VSVGIVGALKDDIGPGVPWGEPAPAGTGGITQVTRFLCGAAYNLPEFRDAVIEHLVEGRDRVMAPSFGVDAVAVTWHCLRARRAEALRELIALVELAIFATSTLVPTIFAGYLVASVWMPRRWARRRKELRERGQAQSALARVGITSVLAANAVLVPALYLLLVATLFAPGVTGSALAGHTSGSVHTAAQGLIRHVARPTLLELPLLLALIAFGERVWRGRMGRRILAADTLTPQLNGLGARLLESRELRSLRRISRQQVKTHLMYGADVFLGAGVEYSSWSFATHLRPKTASLLGDAEAGNRSDARRSWPLLSDSEVIEAVRAGMLRFRSAGSASGDRLTQTTVTDYVFSPPGHEAYGQEPAALQVINLADEEVRHFLGIRVGGWDEDLVTSTFVRPSTHGDILYLEVVVRVLAPVRRRYRIPVEPTAAGVHPNALLAIPRRFAPGNAAAGAADSAVLAARYGTGPR